MKTINFTVQKDGCSVVQFDADCRWWFATAVLMINAANPILPARVCSWLYLKMLVNGLVNVRGPI